jgi:hypothetical protein
MFTLTMSLTESSDRFDVVFDGNVTTSALFRIRDGSFAAVPESSNEKKGNIASGARFVAELRR